jgi:hypothetical protein
MKTDVFSYYTENKDVVKIDDGGHVFLQNDNLGIIVTYLFFGTNSIWNSDSINKRIIVSFFNRDVHLTSNYLKIGKKITLLLDSNDPNYAHSWSLKIDESKKKISLVMEEYPNLGLSFITDEEKNGFFFHINTNLM